ncbi:MAG: alpha-L-arabinofuranosidase, partial [Cyanobacteria bacterium RYN_339]|nr:alpha-L-arabinofuranosidase [Cyanobacteria bacterium RYN_339]
NGAAKMAKMKELTPTWGEHKYLYRIGHGPTDGRNDSAYMTGFHFEKTWDVQTAYPYDDIRNALKEANGLGADQMHVVNFGTSDAAEAGRYVSFLNHAGDANRAAHPIAQQNVQMFEMGNEISWDIVRGHAQYAATETAYATRAKQFAQAMRAKSDVPIKIGAVASTNSNWFGTGWSGGATTVKNILTTMGPDCDFLIFHGYPSWPLTIAGNLDTIIAQNEWSKQKLEKEIKPAIKQYAGGRDVFLANTEFFDNMYSDTTRSRGMFGAMYSADTLLLAMNEDIRTSVQFSMDHGDMSDSAFFIGNDPNNTTAIFKFQKMLAEHWGDNIVATTSTGIPTKTVTGASASVVMPKLSFSAATSGSKTYVMVLNRTNDSDITSAVNVGFTPSAVTAYTLAGTTGWDSANGTVATSTPNLAGMTFKKASVTILEISR